MLAIFRLDRGLIKRRKRQVVGSDFYRAAHDQILRHRARRRGAGRPGLWGHLRQQKIFRRKPTLGQGLDPRSRQKIFSFLAGLFREGPAPDLRLALIQAIVRLHSLDDKSFREQNAICTVLRGEDSEVGRVAAEFLGGKNYV